MTISEALKELYVAIGGDIDDVGNCSSSTEILNKFSVFLGGTGSATQDADAIMNIVAHAEGLNPTLVDKDITANGTYNPADDEADGYKKVVVDVPQDNNIKTLYVSNSLLSIIPTLEKVRVPDGVQYISQDGSTYTGPFTGADRLKEVFIPSTVSTIYTTAFTTCSALEKIVIDKAKGSISGAPWSAPGQCQIVWLG